MATVTAEDGKALSQEEQIAALVAAGISEERARFMVMVESGEIAGDIVELDENGNEVRPDANPNQGA